MAAQWSALAIFILCAVPASVIDIRSYRIPDWLTLPCFALVSAILLVLDRTSFFPSISAAIFGAGLFLCVRLGTKGLGLGDVKFAALVGLLCGIPGCFIAFFAAAASGLLVAVPLVLSHRIRKDTPIPFGPFLAFGAILAQTARCLA